MFKKQKWGTGDYFTIRLTDGSFCVGRVIGQELGALNSAICTFFDWRINNISEVLGNDANNKEIISILFVTRDLLDSGAWHVFNHVPFTKIEEYLDIKGLREQGFVGVNIIGSGNVIKFLNAFYKLSPWDAFHDPEYFDNLLISKNKKPSHVLLK